MTAKTKKLSIDQYNIKAEKLESLSLSQDIFDQKDNPTLLSQAVRVYLSNQRKARAKTKNRSEVRGSTKKIWAQKGTGRARHGDRRAPIFVGGGVAHGPRGVQNYKLKLNKKMRGLAIKLVFSSFCKNKALLVIKDLSKIEAKTKKGLQLITRLKAKDKVLSKSSKIAVIITPDDKENIKRSFRNLDFCSLLSTESLNVYNLSHANFLIFSRKALLKINK